jgi:hypothetical protein
MFAMNEDLEPSPLGRRHMDGSIDRIPQAVAISRGRERSERYKRDLEKVTN